MRARTVLVAIAALAAGAQAPASAQVPSPEDRALTFEDGRADRVGKLRVGRDLSLRRAVRAYGRPSGKRARSRQTCTLRWKRPGISVVGTTFSVPPRRACDTRRLSIQQVRVDGAGWTTDAGLMVGDGRARLDELYREAPRLGSRGRVLETFDFGFGTEPTPTLVAIVSRDTVIRFEVYVGGAGD